MIKRLSLPYSTHKYITRPQESDARIWRYMDFTKFVSMLDAGALFFCRADHFSDPWEGAHTVENLRFRSAIWGATEADAPMIKEVTADLYRSVRKHTFMNCWHVNKVESAAMWKLYVSHNEGIAIQSTVERLIKAFQGDESEIFKVYVGSVKYLDYERERFREGDTLIPFLHKRLSFEHEHELRAVVQAISADAGPLDNIEPLADGLLIEVNLQTLVENIYVAPTCEPWFVDLVKSTATKYGSQIGIQHSDLSRDPLF
jgi:hypothetical protein